MNLLSLLQSWNDDVQSAEITPYNSTAREDNLKISALAPACILTTIIPSSLLLTQYPSLFSFEFSMLNILLENLNHPITVRAAQPRIFKQSIGTLHNFHLHL